MSTAHKTVVAASGWVVLGYTLSQVIRLASNLIMVRLLLPEAFGLAALVGVLMQGLSMFSDVGIGPSIIRSTRGSDQSFINTAWTLQIVRGAGIWACASIAAVPFANFYGEPRLSLLVPVAAVGAFFAGFNSTAIFVENRALRLRAITFLEIFSQLAGLLVMLPWALLAPSVWALVAGGLMHAFAKAVLSHVLLPSSPHAFRWDRSALSELTVFGKWIFLSSMLTFIAGQADKIVLGRLVPLEVLGIYWVAYIWAEIPVQLFKRISQSVFFPTVSQAVRRDGQDAKAQIEKTREILVHLSWPCIAGMMVGMPNLIKLLYPETFEPAGIISSILLFGVWLTILESCYGSILLAHGNSRSIALGTGASAALFLIAVVPSFHAAGVYGVAASFAFSKLGTLFACARGAAKLKLLRLRQDISATVYLALFVLLMLLVQTRLEISDGELLQLILTALLSGGVFAFISTLNWQRLKRVMAGRQ